MSVRISLLPNPSNDCMFHNFSSCDHQLLSTIDRLLLYYIRITGINAVFIPSYGYGDTPEGLKNNRTIFGQLLSGLSDVSGPDTMYTKDAMDLHVKASPPLLYFQLIILTLREDVERKSDAFSEEALTIMLLMAVFMLCMELVIHKKILPFQYMMKLYPKISLFNSMIAGIMVNVVLNLFVGKLAIDITRPVKIIAPFSNLLGLVEQASLNNWKILTQRNSAYHHFILETAKENFPDRLGMIQSNILTYVGIPEILSVLEQMKSNPYCAYVNLERTYLLRWMNHYEDMFAVVEDRRLGVPAGFVFAPNNSIKGKLSYYQMSLLQTEYQRLVSSDLLTRRMQSMKEHNHTAATGSNFKFAQIINPYSLFASLWSGLILATSMFICEKVAVRYVIRLYQKGDN